MRLRPLREEGTDEEAADSRQVLEDRKAIERAKGVSMPKASLGENDAFSRLSKLASDKNGKLVEIAHMILTAEEAFGAGTTGESQK